MDVIVAIQILNNAPQLEVFRDFTTSIPSVVHFIKTDPMTDNFKIVHYLSIRSAAERIRPDRLLFHCVVEPRGIIYIYTHEQVLFSGAETPSSRITLLMMYCFSSCFRVFLGETSFPSTATGGHCLRSSTSDGYGF